MLTDNDQARIVEQALGGSKFNPKKPLVLVIELEKTHGYYHINATFGLCAGHPNSNPRDVEEHGFTHLGSAYTVTSFNGMYLRSFKVTSQTDDGTLLESDRPVQMTMYAVYAGYRMHHDSLHDAEEAAQMAATLKRRDQRLDKLEAQHGRWVTFGQFLGRIATIFGASQFAIPNNDVNQWGNQRLSYRLLDIGAGVNAIDGILARWRSELLERKQKDKTL